MPWTEEAQLRYLCLLPWTIVSETAPEGGHRLRVNELPGAVGRGDTPEAREADLCYALCATLSAYLRAGLDIPHPAVVRSLPWQKGSSSVAENTTFSTATLNILRIVPVPAGE